MDLADSDLQICQKVFKINMDDVPNNVRFTNDYYGANNTQQSKIIFVNGRYTSFALLPVDYGKIISEQFFFHNCLVHMLF